MKKIISLFIALTMVLGTMCSPVLADSQDYISADFEDGTSPFTIQSNTNGSAVVVNAADEGIGTSGKVLKISSGVGTNNTFSAPVSITTTNPVVMEARFMDMGLGEGITKAFTLNMGGTGRTRDNGILALRQNNKIAKNNLGVVLENNDNYNEPLKEDVRYGYLVNEDGSAFEFKTNTWYKMKAVYQIKNAVAVTTLEIFDEDGALLLKEENLAHGNDGAYALQDINTIGFYSRGYGGKDKVLYVDDVFVYDYKDPEPLAVDSGFGGMIEASDSVTIPFNLDVDDTTLGAVEVTGENVPAISSVTAAGKSVTITFENALAADSIYTIKLTGVKSKVGTDIENAAVTLRVKPEMTNVHIDATFEDGTSPFTIKNLSSGATGGAEIVDAALEGVGTNGKVLKVASSNGTLDVMTLADITDASKPVVMEAQFMSMGKNGVNSLFTLNVNKNQRMRNWGLLAIRRNSNIADDFIAFALQKDNNDVHAFGGDNKNGYLVNEDGSPFELTPGTWYKMKAIYQINNQVAITKLEISDNAGALIATAENISNINDIPASDGGVYHTVTISDIGFRAYKNEALYVDNVFVYDYEAPEAPAALAVDQSFSGVVDAADTVTIPFNLDVDETTLGAIEVTGEESAVITSATASEKSITITFENALAAESVYTVNLTGVKSKLGTDIENPYVTLKTKPEMTNAYIDATFDDGISPFSIEKLSSGAAGGAEIVDAAEEGIGTNGKVLKIASSNGTLDVITPASITDASQPVVMETRFMHKGNGGVHGLFTLNINANSRIRDWGILATRRNTTIANDLIGFALQTNNNDTHAFGGNNKNGYLVNEDGTAFEFAPDTWYKMKAIYQVNNQIAVTKLEIYDDADVLLATAENISHKNDIPAADGGVYRTTTISDIGFRAYKNTALYVDNVFVYDYDAPEALAVDSAFSGTVNATNTVTIPFNLDVDETTLGAIEITGEDVPAIATATASGKSITITFENALDADSMCTIKLTGVKSKIGSTLENPNVTLRVKPEMAKAHIDATFEDGTSPFTIEKISSGATGSAEIVDAAVEGIGTNGKVLKIASSNGTIDAITPASITDATKPVVMETRFMHKGTNGVNGLFTLNLNVGSRTRDWGILATRQNTKIASNLLGFALQTNNNDAHAFGGDNKNGYLVNTDGTAFEFAPDTWYKMKAIYQVNNQIAVTKLEIYDDANVLIATAENISQKNDIPAADGGVYHTVTISDIGFRAYKNTALYVDNVYVYDYEAPEALVFENSSILNGAEILPSEAKEITLDFNNKINKESIANLAVTADGEAVDFTAERMGDTSKVKVTITDALVSGKTYKIDYSAISDTNGSSVAGNVTFTVKAGKFVEGITFDKAELTTGTITATASITNSYADAEAVTLVAALYNTENDQVRFINATVEKDKTVNVGENNIPVSITVPADTDVENAMIQVMVLESISSLSPLSAPAVLK